MKKEKKLNNKGFSLVELIIVVAIMAVLVVVLAPQYMKYVEKARESADLDNYRAIVSAVQVYYSDPDHTLEANDYSIAFSGALNGDPADAIELALTDAGVVANGLKMTSEKYKEATLTFTKTSDGKLTVKSSTEVLGEALGIEDTEAEAPVVPPAEEGGES